MSEVPLVGRDGIRDSVSEHLRARRSVVLTGQAGVGKSRLAHEAVKALSDDGVRVIKAQGDYVSQHTPLGAFAFLLRPADEPETDSASALWNLQLALLGGNGRRALVYVDDAHLLDPLSTMLVMRIARTSAARLLLTIRQGEDLPPALVELWSEGSAERIAVSPLERGPLEELVASLIGASLSKETADEFWRLSQGNPLCARELVHEAQARGVIAVENEVASHSGALAMGGRAHELIEARLARLPDAAADGLRAMAMTGPTSLAVMERVAGRDALLELEERELVQISRDGARRVVSTRHPLYGELMSQTLSEGARRDGAGRIYDAVSELPQRRRGDVIARASWGLAGDRRVPSDLLKAAASEALAGHSPERAESFVRACPEADRDWRLCLTLATALVHQGRLDEARELFAEAAASAASGDDRASVAVAWSAAEAMSGRDIAGALQRLDEAARTASSTGIHDAIAAQKGMILMIASGYDDALEAITPVIERSPPAADASLLAALGVGVSMSAWAGEVTNALALVARAADLVPRRHGISFMEVASAIIMESYAHYGAGRYPEAVAVLESVRDRFPGIEVAADVGLGLCHVSAGHPLPGLRLLEPGYPVIEALGDPGRQTAWAKALMLDAGLMIGGEGASLPGFYDDLCRMPPQEKLMFESEVERAIGIWDVHVGDDEAGIARLRTACELAAARGMFTFAIKAIDEMARFGWAEEAAERARPIVARAEPAWVIAHGVARHAQARAANDPSALAAVAEEYGSWGWQLRAAEICAVASGILAERGLPAEAYRQELRSRAWQGLVEGANTVGLQERVSVLAERGDQTAHLVADGLSNTEVAERLVLSPRTVENHLYRTYRQLGLGGRDELADLVNAARAGVG